MKTIKYFSDEIEGVTQLDARGLHCPLPILKAKKVLASMAIGQRLEVCATDSESVGDFKTFTKSQGHLLLKYEQCNEVFVFLIEKGNTEIPPSGENFC